MPRFNAAKSWKKLDDDLSGKFNYLCDLLDEGYEASGLIDSVPIKVEVNPYVGLAFYQDNGSGWEYRGGLEIINSNLFLTANAIKGTESDTKYLLWEDAPGVTGNPNLQLYDNDTRVGEFIISQTYIGLAGVPESASDYSQVSFSARQYSANPDNYSNIILYGNKGTSNYAQINVAGNVYDSSDDYSQLLIKNESLLFSINDVSHFLVSASELTYKTYDVWHGGNFTPGDYLARSGGTMTGALTFSTLYAPSTAGVYFDSYGNIWPQSGVDSGSFWNIRDSLGNVKFKFWLGKADPIEMTGLKLTGDLTMSSNNLYASALYEGGTAISSKYLSIANVAVGSGTSNATGGADTNVSFGKTFATAPKVCANSINGAYTCRIKSVSTTGFVLVISGGSVTFNYIAVSV